MTGSTFTGPIKHAPKGAGPRKWFGHMPMFADPDYVVFWDDFTGIAHDQTNDWTVVKDGSATVALAADTVNGELLMTSQATTDNDGASVQGNEVFVLTVGKKLWFETKAKINDAAESDFYAGLVVNFATDPEACTAAADRVGFQKNEGSAALMCKTEDGGSETSTTTTVSMVNDVYMTLGFYWNGANAVEFYANRQLVATHTAGISLDENMTVGLFHLSGVNTGTKTSTWDYVLVVRER